MRKAILLYMPVPHQGYVSLLERHIPADVFLISAKSIEPFDALMAGQLSRDIRALPRPTVRTMLESVYEPKPEGSRECLNFNLPRFKSFKEIEDLREYSEIIMPDEDVSHLLAKHLPWAKIEFDNPFLRWDWTKSTMSKKVDGTFPITNKKFDRYVMGEASKEAGKSSDFWRNVGAAVPLRDGIIRIATFNEHLPNAQAPYIDGDPRLHMNPGEHPEICTAIHAEQNLIAQAAREGIALNGLSIYVTTLPCSVCARAIKVAGFKKVFFKEGYSKLDAVEILTSAGIEIFQVK